MAYCPKIPIANESEIKECNEKKKIWWKNFNKLLETVERVSNVALKA